MKKLIKVISILTISLISFSSCKNNDKVKKDVVRIEAYHKLDNSNVESKDPYNVVYGQNFQNIDVKVYAFDSKNNKTVVESLIDSPDDGFTYTFTSGSEEEFFSSKPSVDSYVVVFEYCEHLATLVFEVESSTDKPEGFSLYIKDFEYNEVSNETPELRNYPEATTSVEYKYAEYGDNDSLGEYKNYELNKPIIPGRYRLKAKVNSRNYKDVIEYADFTISKCEFPEEKYDINLDELYSFNYDFGKTSLNQYDIINNAPTYHPKDNPEKTLSDPKAELVWKEPSKYIPVFGEEITIQGIYKTACFKDYVVDMKVIFNKAGIIPPYGFGFVDEEGNFSKSIRYDGSVHEITYKTGEINEESLPYHVVNEESTLSAINAGQYSVTFALNDPENTSWYDETSSKEPKTIVWEIEKAPLVPSYTKEYKIELGDYKFIKGDKGYHLDVSSEDDILSKEFKFYIYDEVNSGFRRYGATFTNALDSETQLDIVDNVLVSRPELLNEIYYVKVVAIENSNYKFEQIISLTFYPQVRKTFIFDKDNLEPEEESGKVKLANLYNDKDFTSFDDLTNENSFVSLRNSGGFALIYQNGEENVLQSINSLVATFSSVSAHATSLTCFVLTVEEYQSRLSAYSSSTSESKSAKPLDEDIKVTYSFEENPFKKDYDYLFSFSSYSESFDRTKQYVVCFYIDSVDANHYVEISKIKLDCVRTPYFAKVTNE